ncbi:hypothetical protein EDD15DRAFT_1061110 [Pisolithus albus]|nr:hypothetical protein EDD15DRAFT_1061110 [Pisolithus albus]
MGMDGLCWASWEWGWWEHGPEDGQRARDISCVRQDRRTLSTRPTLALKRWQIPRLFTIMISTTSALPVHPLQYGWLVLGVNGRCSLSGRNSHTDEMDHDHLVGKGLERWAGRGCWRNFATRRGQERLDPDFTAMSTTTICVIGKPGLDRVRGTPVLVHSLCLVH